MSAWDEITSFANIRRAAKRAARGKRTVAGAARFLERLEIEAFDLQRELIADTWRPSAPTNFTIYDPKERVITAAPFRDRVVHHAFIDPLEATFDAALMPNTFACRKDLGTHKALDHAQMLVRRHSHFLKLDIAKCFESIEHAVVIETLAEIKLEPEVMRLVRRVLGGVEERLGCGLPIGNLTSQWFANLVLGRVDRFVVEQLGVAGYVRYMDDFVLFADEKASLRGALDRVAEFVAAELHLRLKERATILAPVSQGLPFLGWRIYRGTRRLRPENKKRTRRRLKLRRFEFRSGRLEAERYADALRSVSAHLEHGETGELRRASFAQLVLDEQELGSGSFGSANRVNRGGSFNNAASNARSANRNNNTPGNQNNNLGLRPAKASHRPIARASFARCAS